LYWQFNWNYKQLKNFVPAPAEGDGPVWEEGERPPSPIPEEQKIQNEEGNEKNEEDLMSPPKHCRNEDDELGERDATQQSTLSPALDTPVCAKNISLTPSGERVILWTR